MGRVRNLDPRSADTAAELVEIARNLAAEVDALEFRAPVTHVYNPLRYAWANHRAYLERHARHACDALLLGMNPGPWGMAQTGVPFGEVELVRDWLQLREPIGEPAHQHAKRPVTGLACARSEVSGRRVWGWARERFGTPERFFAHYLVWNYCPLSFMEESGRNRTPDKLPTGEREPLLTVCDAALRRAVEVLAPGQVIGIGRWAEQRARAALGAAAPTIGTILHPSPASPAANRGWADAAERQLAALGLPIAPCN
ncbi:MAG TPA: uracil-DNA glycosylase family protein [Planctomycetota bacterium]